MTSLDPASLGVKIPFLYFLLRQISKNHLDFSSLFSPFLFVKPNLVGFCLHHSITTILTKGRQVMTVSQIQLMWALKWSLSPWIWIHHFCLISLVDSLQFPLLIFPCLLDLFELDFYFLSITFQPHFIDSYVLRNLTFISIPDFCPQQKLEFLDPIAIKHLLNGLTYMYSSYSLPNLS